MDPTPLARWKDLCIDATDATRLGAFWASVLGLRVVPLDDGDVRLDDDERPERTVWVNTVPEPRTVKQRVHLDVRVGDHRDLLALGATVHTEPPPDHASWWVLADPEGGELCASVREGYGLPAAWYELVVDAADPQAQARWWAEVLGATVAPDEGKPWSAVEGIDGYPFEYLVFQAVPEPKTVKNRIHWDLTAADVPALVAAGATVLREPDSEIFWHVLADPEGNEFCAFAPDAPDAPDEPSSE